MVGSGIHEGAHPGGAKLAHLAEHLGRAASQAVGTERRHQGGDPCAQRLPCRELRGAKTKAPLAATAGDVGQRIYQSGHQIAAASVHPRQRPVGGDRQSLPEPGDAAIGHQQILAAKRGRTIEFGPFDQGQHAACSS